MKNFQLVFNSILLMLVFTSTSGFAQNDDLRNNHFNLTRGIAAEGFDPVTLFIEKKAVRANGSISYIHKGVKYFFTSSKNLKQFKNTPSKFEPQYGGWCAYQMSLNGKKNPAKANIFTVKNNKLYFFESKVSMQKWLATEISKEQADINWVSIFN
ncbi:MAG: YHS domain-containing (seleno)protein [Saprospiraceae bacterium]